jgi:hypothetical protein
MQNRTGLIRLFLQTGIPLPKNKSCLLRYSSIHISCIPHFLCFMHFLNIHPHTTHHTPHTHTTHTPTHPHPYALPYSYTPINPIHPFTHSPTPSLNDYSILTFFQGASNILPFYLNSPVLALMQLFPKIGLKKEEFIMCMFCLLLLLLYLFSFTLFPYRQEISYYGGYTTA